MDNYTEYSEDILIKEEHAYACSNDFTKDPLALAHHPEIDPLRLSPTIPIENNLITEIKTEVSEPEIKMEIETDLYASSSSTVGENVPPLLAESTNFLVQEVVPRAEFVELQQKCQVLENNIVRHLEENTQLKLEIAKWKIYKQKNLVTTFKMDKLNKDFLESQNQIQLLRNEIIKLNAENEDLQNRQSDIFEENYRYLEKTITDLRHRAKTFMTFHQKSIEHIKLLETYLSNREGDNKDVEKKLNGCIRKLCKMKYKIEELSKLKRKYNETSKQNHDLFKIMKEHANTKHAYETQIAIFRQELKIKIEEKNKEIIKNKAEMAHMATAMAETETTVKLLRDKYKDLFRVADQSKQMVTMLKTKLSTKDIELKEATDKLSVLQEQLRIPQKTSCDYCGL